jgi:hypothetical protein
MARFTRRSTGGEALGGCLFVSIVMLLQLLVSLGVLALFVWFVVWLLRVMNVLPA